MADVRTEKECSRCGVLKPAGGFYTRVDGSLRGPCRECWLANQRHPDARAKNAASKRRANLRANYGLDEDEYDAFLNAQEGVCAICARPEQSRHRTGTRFTLSVDHDHNTGAVRGLLCQRCNRAIGLLRDDPELLEAAKAYLERER